MAVFGAALPVFHFIRLFTSILYRLQLLVGFGFFALYICARTYYFYTPYQEEILNSNFHGRYYPAVHLDMDIC